MCEFYHFDLQIFFAVGIVSYYNRGLALQISIQATSNVQEKLAKATAMTTNASTSLLLWNRAIVPPPLHRYDISPL